MQLLGWLLVGLAGAQLIPAAASAVWGEPSLPFLASAIASAVFGLPLAFGLTPDSDRIRRRDRIALASGAWLLAAIFGALPYVMTGSLHFLDAVFESVAGFTTTASSVVTSVERLPKSLLLWRSMTQWIGGIGVLALAVALLPFVEIGGMQLFATDDSRSAADTGRTRVSAIMRRLFFVYLGLTVMACVLLAWAGLGFFDALCHALTSVSTGGFSTRSGSVGSFGSEAVEWVIVAVMFLGAMSFVCQYRVLTGRGWAILRDGEFRYYAVTIIAGSVILGIALSSGSSAGGDVVRPAVFQAVSMLSGAGYYTADYQIWGGLAHVMVMGLMVMGGMSGSTTGGLKSLRLVVGVRALRNAFTMLLHPHTVHRLKYGGRMVPDEIVAAIWAFFTAFFMLVGCAAALVAGAGYDLETSISVAFSVTANVGPALGAVGPGADYSHFPDYVKLGLSFCMLAGRLDIFTLFVLLQPKFWRS
jgi:trk system potassium uptake protein TrkH